MKAVLLADLSLSEKELKSDLENKGFGFKPAEHAFWRAQKDGLTVTLYKSGKILAQGKGAEAFYTVLSGSDGSASINSLIEHKNKRTAQPQSVPCKEKPSWIGTDESGKGDFFGPLVVAGVLVDESNFQKLKQLGIQDSKKMSDNLIQSVAPKIKELSAFSVVTINPAKYNELYKNFKNLNSLLAWGHARVIENILEKKPCEYALSDKFGDESLIKNALLKNGKQINLEQRVRAEEDLAVAAASVLARDEFLKRIKMLSGEYGVNLPKGASETVVNQGRLFVSRNGFEKLVNVAKLHFKTTEKLKS